MVEWLRTLFGKKKCGKRVVKELPRAEEQNNGKERVWHAFLVDEDFLCRLEERIGIRSVDHTSLLNVAMSFLEWAADTVEDGRIVASVDEAGGKYRELVMGCMEYPTRLARVRNLIEDGIENELTTVSALEEDALEYLTVMW